MAVGRRAGVGVGNTGAGGPCPVATNVFVRRPEPASMADASLQLEPAGQSRLDDVERLLAANDLPSADVRSGPAQFYVAAAGGDVVGAGGLELYDDAGLLRSVAVRESEQGNGVGTAISEGLEKRARAEGVAVLYLLTTTAAEFFAARGYEAVDRSEAPPAIRETTQFEDLCPATAVCMRTRL
jgi:amino-acid N-acetyltransferase